MKELHSKKFLAPNKNKGAAGLNALAGMLNAHAGVIAPKENLPAPAAIRAATLEPTQVISTPQPPATPPTAGAVLNKIVLTGRLMSGKDFAAAQAGLKIFSLAEPLYGLQKLFFGTDDKTLPGARTFLQAAGQIGRNEISAAYPLSVERANFVALVREQANRLPGDFGVDWTAYGRHADLWLDALLVRVRAYVGTHPGARVAVTNARFSNELQRLTAEGFVSFHVMTSAASWGARLMKAGLSPDSPACKDFSEQLAASLDQNVIKTLSKEKNGLKLRAIWSDASVPPPSARLLTVAEFCAFFPKI